MVTSGSNLNNTLDTLKRDIEHTTNEIHRIEQELQKSNEEVHKSKEEIRKKEADIKQKEQDILKLKQEIARERPITLRHEHKSGELKHELDKLIQEKVDNNRELSKIQQELQRSLNIRK